MADKAGQELKYGGGDPRLSQFLTKLSDRTNEYESYLQANDILPSRQAMADEFNRWSDTYKAQ